MSFLQKGYTAIASLFTGREQRTYTDEEYNDVLFSTEEVAEEEEMERPDSVIQRRTGTITRLEANYGLIDDKYYFELADLNQKNVRLNQRVRYVAYRCSENVEWKVKQVNVIEKEEWSDENEGTVDASASRLISENFAMEKVVSTKVISKKDRTLVLGDGDFTCNLDRIQAEFLPQQGDWVTVNAIVEVKEDDISKDYIIDVESMKPVRQKIFDGKITDLSQNNSNEVIGIISNEVYFTANVCEPGYRPMVNDKVVANAVESEQGNLTWRAISVISVGSNESDSLLSRIEDERLFDSKYGVSVTVNCAKKSLKIGDSTKFEVRVENCGTDTQILLNGHLKNSNINQIMKLLTRLDDPIIISPGMCYSLYVEALAQFSGTCSDILSLTFEGEWKLGCMLEIYVDIEEEMNTRLQKITTSVPQQKEKPTRNANLEKRMAAVKKLYPTPSGFLVSGIRTVRTSKFVPKQLPLFNIPDFIRKIVVGDGETFRKYADIESDLILAYPIMAEELSKTNYINKFHNLLHLEDLELLINIKKYDKPRACFEKRGEYLELQVPNLAESRPSLVVGDSVVASEPFAVPSENSIRYEGIIHKVLSDSIRLKFNDSFHNSYDGKDYAITFEHNRTPIRRCHQAINVIVDRGHPGYSWLFPNALGNLKTAQVNIVGEFPLLNTRSDEHICEEEEEEPRNGGANARTSTNQKSNIQKPTLEVLADLSDSEEECEDEVVMSNKSDQINSSPKEVHNYASVNHELKDTIIEWEDESRKKLLVSKGLPVDSPPCSEGPSFVRRDVILKWVNLSLNHYQREAVRNALRGEARPLPYIIFGPPGTGKTVTVVETILQIMFLMPDSRLLVCTPSNSSADLICERLLSWNLLKPGDLVRLVGYKYMTENRMSTTIKPYCTCMDRSTDKNGMNKTTSDEEGIKFSSRDVIGRHRITVSTCATVAILYNMGFPKSHFTHIIVDEAGQATEPEIMIPLAFLSTNGQAILAGDPTQLGPVVTSRVARNMGLGESFLSRLSIRFPYHRDPESHPATDGYDPRLVTRLLCNYRSLPNILNLYSTLFYDSNLIPKICEKCSDERKLVNRMKEALQQSAYHKVSEIIFQGVKGHENQDEDSPSWFNELEVIRVVYFVMTLNSQNVSSEDIGIVTPYQKQVIKIRDLLRECQIELPKIGTVEEFQGQERQVIIISTVRSDEGLLHYDRKYTLGFVGEKQRVNVAISRARALLIIVGNPHLLATNNVWKSLIRMCKQRDCYVGCDLPSSLDVNI